MKGKFQRKEEIEDRSFVLGDTFMILQMLLIICQYVLSNMLLIYVRDTWEHDIKNLKTWFNEFLKMILRKLDFTERV